MPYKKTTKVWPVVMFVIRNGVLDCIPVCGFADIDGDPTPYGPHGEYPVGLFAIATHERTVFAGDWPASLLDEVAEKIERQRAMVQACEQRAATARGH